MIDGLKPIGENIEFIDNGRRDGERLIDVLKSGKFPILNHGLYQIVITYVETRGFDVDRPVAIACAEYRDRVNTRCEDKGKDMRYA